MPHYANPTNVYVAQPTLLCIFPKQYANLKFTTTHSAATAAVRGRRPPPVTESNRIQLEGGVCTKVTILRDLENQATRRACLKPIYYNFKFNVVSPNLFGGYR